MTWREQICRLSAVMIMIHSHQTIKGVTGSECWRQVLGQDPTASPAECFNALVSAIDEPIANSANDGASEEI